LWQGIHGEARIHGGDTVSTALGGFDTVTAVQRNGPGR
jgi:hypothetical protein